MSSAADSMPNAGGMSESSKLSRYRGNQMKSTWIKGWSMIAWVCCLCFGYHGTYQMDGGKRWVVGCFQPSALFPLAMDDWSDALLYATARPPVSGNVGCWIQQFSTEVLTILLAYPLSNALYLMVLSFLDSYLLKYWARDAAQIYWQWPDQSIRKTLCW